MQIRDRVKELRRVPADTEWHDAFEKAGDTSAVDELRQISFVLPTCGPLLAACGPCWPPVAPVGPPGPKCQGKPLGFVGASRLAVHATCVPEAGN